MYIFYDVEKIVFICKEKINLEYPYFEMDEVIAQKLINRPHEIVKIPNVKVMEDNFSNFFEEIETVIEPSLQELLTQQVANLAIENKKKDMAIESLAKTVSTLNIKLQQLEGGTN